jgi:EpsD family peptidyl-prolyl cis-trans isomerase
MNRNTSGRPTIAGIALLAATLVACGSEERNDVSQVVARVNDSEITISQLRATLLARGETEPTPDATRRTLEGLVNEQLLVEAALRNDLDRDPAVVQALEAARRQILANVFVERLVYPHVEVSAGEQTAYFREHPELFARRRVYQLAVFTCQAPLSGDIMTALDAVKTADEVGGVLEAGGLACSTQGLMRSAEQLALNQLPQFTSAAVGDVIVQARDGGETALTLITGIQDSPLTLEQAQPIIQQYLANVRNAEALDFHLKQARAAASVIHIDTTLFAASAPEDASAPAPVSEPELTPDSGAAILN